MNLRTEVGLADLARCLVALAPENHRATEAVLDLLGLARAPERPSPGPAPTAATTPPAARQRAPATTAAPRVGSGATDEPESEADLPRLRPAGKDPTPSLIPWRLAAPLKPFTPEQHLRSTTPLNPLLNPQWMRELLTVLLVTDTIDDRPDDLEVISRIACGKPLDPLPLLHRPSLRRGVQVLVDMGEGMEPFSNDAWALVHDLERLLGGTSVSTVTFWDAPTRGVGPFAEAYRPPQPWCPVLALTDLGAGGPPVRPERGRPEEWRSLAALLSAQGSPLVVLVPYDSSRWPADVRSWAVAVHWDRTTTFTQALSARRTARQMR